MNKKEQIQRILFQFDGIPEMIWAAQRAISVMKPIQQDLWDLLYDHVVLGPLDFNNIERNPPLVRRIAANYSFASSFYQDPEIIVKVLFAKPEWVIEEVIGPIHRSMG